MNLNNHIKQELEIWDERFSKLGYKPSEDYSYNRVYNDKDLKSHLTQSIQRVVGKVLEGLAEEMPKEKELIIPAKFMSEQDENFKTLGFNDYRTQALTLIKSAGEEKENK